MIISIIIIIDINHIYSHMHHREESCIYYIDVIVYSTLKTDKPIIDYRIRDKLYIYMYQRMFSDKFRLKTGKKMLTRHFSELFFVINWSVSLVYTRKHLKTTNKVKNV